MVELSQKVFETDKAVLGKVIIEVGGVEKSWKTWIPKSVIGQDGRIADWFQEKLVERFSHERVDD